MSSEEDKGEKNFKLVLMGRQDSGKTSMQSIIFANLTPNEANLIGFSSDITVSKFKFLGMSLYISDCAGQENLAKHYLQNPERYFTEVKLMIYVFDVTAVDNKSLEYFARTIELLEKFSPEAKLFILIHKMDKISHSKRNEVFEEKKTVINQYLGKIIEVSEYFATSIWEETLYKVVGRFNEGMEQDDSESDT